MSTQTTCSTCGTPVDPSMKFCRKCGAPVAGATAGAGAQAAAPAAAPALPTCTTCGTAATNPNQKFCAVCGGPLGGAAAASAASAQAAVPGAPAAQDIGAGAAQNASAGFAQAQSKLNDFMGASIDTSNVGANFNAQNVTLANADEGAMAAAFSYFGKAYSAAGQTAATADIAAVERREQAEAQEAEARAKEERDFSAHEGGTFCGAFTTKLQAGAAPTAAMVAASHDSAAKRQDKNRLKRKVALGDMDKGDAVAAAERL